MTKNFYVVLPFYLSEILGLTGSKDLFKKTNQTAMTEDHFQRGKYQLWQRMEFVALGLRRCGLRAAPLTTPDIIEFLWSLHHPKEAEFGYYPEIPPELNI